MTAILTSGVCYMAVALYLVVLSVGYTTAQTNTTLQTNTTQCQQLFITNPDLPVYITSPNYKVYFRNDTDVCWTVRAWDAGNYVIRVSATYFRLQPADDVTCRGHLEVRDGCTPLSPLLGRYCRHPPPIFTSGGCVHLGFKATGQGTGDKGFRLKVSVYQRAKVITNPLSDTSCTHLRLDSLTALYYLSSPGYPYRYISDLDTCSVLHLAETLQGRYYIRLQVLASRLEESSDCDKDEVEVRDGGSASAKMLVSWCGGTVPLNITSCGDSLYVRFTSDSTHEDQGYNAVYHALPREPDTECGYPESRPSGQTIGLILGFVGVVVACFCGCTCLCRKWWKNRDAHDDYL